MLAAGFVFLSADEVLELHESITKANKALDLGIPMFRDQNGAWVTVYAILAVILLLTIQKPLRRMIRSDPISAAMVAGGMVTVIVGAVGIEVGGYFDIGLLRKDWLQIAIEETIELAGVSLVVVGSMRHLASVLQESRQDEAATISSSMAADGLSDPKFGFDRQGRPTVSVRSE